MVKVMLLKEQKESEIWGKIRQFHIPRRSRGNTIGKDAATRELTGRKTSIKKGMSGILGILGILGINS